MIAERVRLLPESAGVAYDVTTAPNCGLTTKTERPRSTASYADGHSGRLWPRAYPKVCPMIRDGRTAPRLLIAGLSRGEIESILDSGPDVAFRRRWSQRRRQE